MNIHYSMNIGVSSMPTVIDLVFAVVVFVAGAFLDYYVLWPYLLRKVNGGDVGALTRVYSIIMAWLWLATIFVAGRWWLLARPYTALWLFPPHGWRLLASALALLAGAALWLLQTRSLTRLGAEKRAALRRRSGHLLALAPHSTTEYRWF